MATLIPALPKDCSRSERMVYERLGRELPDEWVVLHSLGLPGHETKFWGEADIVVLSTKGFFALEVKGGKVSCSDGVWYFGVPGKKGYSRREDPWSQSKGTMVAIRKRLAEADRSWDDLLFGFGVVMPMEHFTATGAEIMSEVLLDKRDFPKNMMRYIAKLEEFWEGNWQAKHGRRYRHPTEKEIRQARQLLRPDIESAYSIGTYLTGVEAALLQLTNDQIRAARRMQANPRTIVRGMAGTGKSILALERARQLSEAGRKVLFLTFNQLLARHFAAGLKEDGRACNVEVRHAHGLYREAIEKAGLLEELRACEGQSDFYSRVFPQLFINAAFELDYPCWDALVVDEAQDLMTPDNLDAFDLILKDGLMRGHWHFFLDPNQNIYGTDIQEQVEARLADAHPAFDDLWENCRNTKQVAVQTSVVSGLDLAIDGAIDGDPCPTFYYRSDADLAEQLERLVDKLLRKDVIPQDIIILSTRRLENSSAAALPSLGGLPIFDVSSGGAAPKKSIHFATMHSFKGLERAIVVALDMAEIGEEHYAMLHYAGLSRACALLYTFLPESGRAKYAGQMTAFGARQETRLAP